jgi:hypothetical protein
MVFSSGLNPLSRVSCPNCGQAAAAAIAGAGVAIIAMTRANAAANSSRIFIDSSSWCSSGAGQALRTQPATVRPKVAEVPIGSQLMVIAVTVGSPPAAG